MINKLGCWIWLCVKLCFFIFIVCYGIFYVVSGLILNGLSFLEKFVLIDFWLNVWIMVCLRLMFLLFVSNIRYKNMFVYFCVSFVFNFLWLRCLNVVLVLLYCLVLCCFSFFVMFVVLFVLLYMVFVYLRVD